MDEDLNLVDYQTRGSREYSITKSTIDYAYETSIMQKHLITNEDCWLASYSWHLYDYCCMFYVRCLRPNYNGQSYMSDNLLVTSYNWEDYYDEESDTDIETGSYSACVVPVVTLKPNIHMNKKGDTWELKP